MTHFFLCLSYNGVLDPLPFLHQNMHQFLPIDKTYALQFLNLFWEQAASESSVYGGMDLSFHRVESFGL